MILKILVGCSWFELIQFFYAYHWNANFYFYFLHILLVGVEIVMCGKICLFNYWMI